MLFIITVISTGGTMHFLFCLFRAVNNFFLFFFFNVHDVLPSYMFV